MTTIVLPVFSVPITGAPEYFSPVRAEIVDVAPHLLDGTFAVHKAVDHGPPYGKWTVTNIETGHSVGHGYERDEAIECAKAKLAKVTPEQFDGLCARVEPAVRAAEGRASNGPIRLRRADPAGEGCAADGRTAADGWAP